MKVSRKLDVWGLQIKIHFEELNWIVGILYKSIQQKKKKE